MEFDAGGNAVASSLKVEFGVDKSLMTIVRDDLHFNAMASGGAEGCLPLSLGVQGDFVGRGAGHARVDMCGSGEMWRHVDGQLFGARV